MSKLLGWRHLITRKTLGIAALMILAVEARAGAICGSLHLGTPPRQVTAGGTVLAPAGVEQAVIWVDSLPPQVASFYRARPRTLSVVQSNRMFAPLVTTVTVGSTVRFANRDRVYHNVFSVSPTQPFDLGKYPPRSSQEVTFEHEGVVNLYCDIHPWMAAYVVVLPHRVFTRPNRGGYFHLPVLPAGHYRLHVWHPSFGETQRAVEVPGHRDTTVTVSL